MRFLLMSIYYTVIREQKDAESLQTDLDHPQEWEKDRQMVFNTDKCEHIRITNKPNVIEVGWLFWAERPFETVFQSISGRLPERGRREKRNDR